jgi:hypothetical protein
MRQPPDGDPLLAYVIQTDDPRALEAAHTQPAVVIADEVSGPRPATLLVSVMFCSVLGLGLIVGPVVAWATGRQVDGSVPPAVVWAVAWGLGGFLLLLGIAGLRGLKYRKLSYLAILPDGIVIRRNRRRVLLKWTEIAAVQPAVVDRYDPYTQPEDLLVPRRMRMRVSTYLRFAPVTPGFGDRTDLRGVLLRGPRAIVGPEPFERYVFLPHKMLADPDNVPSVALADAALRRFAGPRFAGTVVERPWASGGRRRQEFR